jgi:MFS family permease
MLLKSIYSVAVVILEIPSGYCADVWGRKKSLLLGCILAFMGFAIYSFSYNFLAFLLAEIILGAGHSLVSGADSAMLYDTLVQEKRKDEYLKYEGKISSMGNFAEAIAGIIGGLLAVVSLRLPFICQSIIAFIGIPAAYYLIEPKSTIEKTHKGIKDVFRIVHYSIIENKILRWSIILSSVIGCATLSMAWFAQPYFKEINIPLPYFGVLWTTLNLSAALTSIYAYRLDNLFGQKKLIIILSFGIVSTYIISGLFISTIGLVAIFIFYLVRGVASPLLKDYINRITDSEHRATVLSVRNFMIRLLFAFIAPGLGVLTDTINIGTALVFAGCIFFIFTSIAIIGIYSFPSEKRK